MQRTDRALGPMETTRGLPQIEFELSAEQFALMGFPRLQQGLPLSAVLDGGVLLPEPGPDPWYTVQKEPLTPPSFLRRSALRSTRLPARLWRRISNMAAHRWPWWWLTAGS